MISMTKIFILFSRETHHVAEAQRAKNERMRQALGLNPKEEGEMSEKDEGEEEAPSDSDSDTSDKKDVEAKVQ